MKYGESITGVVYKETIWFGQDIWGGWTFLYLGGGGSGIGEKVMRHEGVGMSLLLPLLRFCAINRSVNNWFQKKPVRYGSNMHPI